jgi:N-acetylneuraminic acid mutarotase
LPIAVKEQATGEIAGKIYNVGGKTTSAIVKDNQIYDPVANTWSKGKPMPTGLSNSAYAVLNDVLYVIGGTTDGQLTGNSKEVWAYSASGWERKKSLLGDARQGAVAVAENKFIYVMGGTTAQYTRLSEVERYDPATNNWTYERHLRIPKAGAAHGLLQSTIVAASGEAAGGPTGDNEGYDADTNVWDHLAPDPRHRVESCSGVIDGVLYSAGGVPADDEAVRVNESFNLSANEWTTLAPLLKAAVSTGAAVHNGQLYCFGGGSTGAVGFQGKVYSIVQIYQP